MWRLECAGIVKRGVAMGWECGNAIKGKWMGILPDQGDEHLNPNCERSAARAWFDDQVVSAR
jgi:hypothetical protein